MWQTQDGYLWIGTREGTSRFNGFQISKTTPSEEQLSVQQLGPTGEGRKWLVGQGNLLVGRETKNHWSFDGGIARGGRLVKRGNHDIWNIIPISKRHSNGTDDPIFAVRQWDGDIFQTKATIPMRRYSFVSSSLVDQKNRIWWTVDRQNEVFYSFSQGVIEEHQLPKNDIAEHLWYNDVSNTIQLAGHLGIYLLREEGWSLAVPFQTPLKRRIFSIIQDPSGFYIMTVQGIGVVICQSDGTLNRLAPATVDLPSICQAIYRTRDGSIWIGGHSGLYQLYRNSLTHWPAPEKIRYHPVASIQESEMGIEFTGPDGHYLLPPGQELRLTKDSSSSFPKKPPSPLQKSVTQSLPSGAKLHHFSIAADNTTWATFNQHHLGWRKDERWHSTHCKNLGIPPQANLLCSKEGGLWFFGHEGGVYRFQRTAVESWLLDQTQPTPTPRIFGLSDGLSSEESDYQSHALFEDFQGRIWIGTRRGACVFHPTHFANLQEDDLPYSAPPINIESIHIDDKKCNLDNPIKITAESNRLKISYTGIHLSHPEMVNYRYRLTGYDSDWHQVGNHRIARYQNLPPGDYQFEVAATYRERPWPTSIARLSIIKQPHWWQRASLKITFFFLLGLLLLLLFYLRIHHFKKKAQEQQNFARLLMESQEKERKRIAGELHDGLGQELALIKACSQLVGDNLTDKPRQQERLHEVIEMTNQAIASVRQITAELRPAILERLGLPKALETLAEKISTGTDLQIICKPDALASVHELEDQMILYRIIQESLNNSLKHAQATKISITSETFAQFLRLTYKDNGQGFSEKAIQRGLGLDHIRERARLLGGTATIQSDPGKGVEINVTIPLNPAK